MECSYCKTALPREASYCFRCGEPVLVCADCDTTLPQEANFCFHCGKPQRVCAGCGAPLPPDAKFCLYCGAARGGVAASARPVGTVAAPVAPAERILENGNERAAGLVPSGRPQAQSASALLVDGFDDSPKASHQDAPAPATPVTPPGAGADAAWDTCEVVEVKRDGRWVYCARLRGPRGTTPLTESADFLEAYGILDAKPGPKPPDPKVSGKNAAVLARFLKGLTDSGWDYISARPAQGIHAVLRRPARA